ncbi:MULTISPECIES: hypothetical protein [unclassified Agrobacterium]|uniref:hypothetical protein n=1 Tax=unclassified Agrobacterium TaxID=2632611 RepID=UPI00244B558B|nr:MULTISPECIES: hypothetical protein [unclassified Agrobacterium]MDH0612363.1 hypothetical protein [Agrobacterium sp. GD03872]MDH0696260.1 hypothetical protein [Agrobacterium sp. GD03871]MDH1059162.1 hypothetical protein [Agrobacterium sp. GD03992]MDH2210523.1 hypothetical protein [Agrobacterium sp. GD03643]MDH2218028.1 hypothetical protein [Agrobacterium sp. GD03638]
MTKEGLLQKEIAASVFFAVLLFRPNKHQALTLIGAQKHDAVRRLSGTIGICRF